jgi:hypothetical protein
MNALSRTELPAPVKAHLAASAISGQGQHGALSALAEQFDVTRPTVYAVGSEAREVLEGHFNNTSAAVLSEWKPVQVCVDFAQLVRAVIGLRGMAPNSIRIIEELVPVVYPGVQLGYGTVQAIAAEAETRAALFNAGADLSAIKNAAPDEMFSQGDPVLAGVDLDSGYLFALALRQGRSGDDWQEVLKRAKKQKLDLEVVVKDAAKGIAAGVCAVFPNAEQRDDCFHALYEMNKVLSLLQRKAYGAIERELEAEEALSKARLSGKGHLAKLAQKLRWARVKAGKAIEMHDAFETAARAAAEAMELVSLETGLVRQPKQMHQEIEAAASQMLALDHGRCRKVGRYLRNRAPGLALHLHGVNEALEQVSVRYGSEAVVAACLVHRLATDLRKNRRPWEAHSDKRRLRETINALENNASEAADRVLGIVDVINQKRHRASSAIEGFNAALRPFLYVHKGVTQGFLELFRARHNLKTRRWGRHKGTSAHEVLTGERVDDWLTALGYPPSASALN